MARTHNICQNTWNAWFQILWLEFSSNRQTDKQTVDWGENITSLADATMVRNMLTHSEVSIRRTSRSSAVLNARWAYITSMIDVKCTSIIGRWHKYDVSAVQPQARRDVLTTWRHKQQWVQISLRRIHSQRAAWRHKYLLAASIEMTHIRQKHVEYWPEKQHRVSTPIWDHLALVGMLSVFFTLNAKALSNRKQSPSSPCWDLGVSQLINKNSLLIEKNYIWTHLQVQRQRNRPES